MKRYFVKPPSGSNYMPGEFDTLEEANKYASMMPSSTRIFDGLAPVCQPAPRDWTEADPAYYRGADQSYDVIDVIANFKLDFDIGCAIKYLLRAGKKPGNAFLDDLRKAHRVVTRRIAREEGRTKTVDV